MTTVIALTTITSTDYNTAQGLITDVLGIGENGWGIPLTASSPTSYGRVIHAYDYNNLIKDINIAHTHIVNSNTTTAAVVTGTTVVSASVSNELFGIVDWLHDDTRRYTCHPNQYFYLNLAGGGSTRNIVPAAGTSTRTLAWGANDTTEINHQVSCTFRNRLAARYYFNQGNYLTWKPYYSTSTGLINDLDAEWANFFDYLSAPEREYRYGRTEYLVGDSTTEYTSGTLYVNVIANRSDDQSKVDFIIEYGNSATPNLLITPAVGTYFITL